MTVSSVAKSRMLSLGDRAGSQVAQQRASKRTRLEGGEMPSSIVQSDHAMTDTAVQFQSQQTDMSFKRDEALANEALQRAQIGIAPPSISSASLHNVSDDTTSHPKSAFGARIKTFLTSTFNTIKDFFVQHHLDYQAYRTIKKMKKELVPEVLRLTQQAAKHAQEGRDDASLASYDRALETYVRGLSERYQVLYFDRPPEADPFQGRFKKQFSTAKGLFHICLFKRKKSPLSIEDTRALLNILEPLPERASAFMKQDAIQAHLNKIAKSISSPQEAMLACEELLTIVPSSHRDWYQEQVKDKIDNIITKRMNDINKNSNTAQDKAEYYAELFDQIPISHKAKFMTDIQFVIDDLFEGGSYKEALQLATKVQLDDARVAEYAMNAVNECLHQLKIDPSQDWVLIAHQALQAANLSEEMLKACVTHMTKRDDAGGYRLALLCARDYLSDGSKEAFLKELYLASQSTHMDRKGTHFYPFGKLAAVGLLPLLREFMTDNNLGKISSGRKHDSLLKTGIVSFNHELEKAESFATAKA